jgi:hypothetical protein
MKRTIGFALALFSLVASLTSLAQSGDKIKDIEIKLKFAETPRVTFENFSNPNSSKSYRWLVIEVTYTVPDMAGKGSEYTTDWLDSVEMNLELLMPSAVGTKGAVLLTGKTVFWAIALDGKKHKAEGYIPPHIVRRYSKPGMKFTPEALNGMYASVSFISKGENILGKQYATPKAGMEPKQIASLFAKLKEELPPKAKLEDTIYSRDNTPWAYVDFDNYELIKMDTGKR